MNDDNYPFVVRCPYCDSELEELMEFHYLCTNKECGGRFMTFRDIRKKKKPKQKNMSQFF
jgi:hypothetical protein